MNPQTLGGVCNSPRSGNADGRWHSFGNAGIASVARPPGTLAAFEQLGFTFGLLVRLARIQPALLKAQSEASW